MRSLITTLRRVDDSIGGVNGAEGGSGACRAARRSLQASLVDEEVYVYCGRNW